MSSLAGSSSGRRVRQSSATTCEEVISLSVQREARTRLEQLTEILSSYHNRRPVNLQQPDLRDRRVYLQRELLGLLHGDTEGLPHHTDQLSRLCPGSDQRGSDRSTGAVVQ